MLSSGKNVIRVMRIIAIECTMLPCVAALMAVVAKSRVHIVARAGERTGAIIAKLYLPFLPFTL